MTSWSREESALKQKCEKSDTILDNTILWAPQESMRVIEEVNVYPNISIYNRTIYTFGVQGEAFIKFSRINKAIQSYDELAYLDSRSCMFRIGDDEYVVVIKQEVGDKLAVLGVLSERYVKSNNLRQYDALVKQRDEWEVVQLDDVFDRQTVTLDRVVEALKHRIHDKYNVFASQIARGGK